MNIIISALLWRIRGGLRIFGKKLPLNKIWYAVYFSLNFGACLEQNIVYFIACYTSYQLYGWGLYIGALFGSQVDKDDRECELIDDILFSIRVTFGEKSAIVWNYLLGRIVKVEPKTYWLYEYPKAFGFLGTSLTGLIITFIWGLCLNDLYLMISGLAMGLCYWVGGKIEPYLPLGKNGWNWGEWIFGAYLGLIFEVLYG